jgi:NAD(P)-dependent dehydrogenase (short-subunit alcohol dehydrogenase family)
VGVFALTGAASGMGEATARLLRAAGHQVIGVDLRGADIAADLGTAEGRRTAIDGVAAASGGTLDGAVMFAGVGGATGRPASLLGWRETRRSGSHRVLVKGNQQRIWAYHDGVDLGGPAMSRIARDYGYTVDELRKL